MGQKEKDLTTCYPIIHNSVKIIAAITGKSCKQKEQEYGMIFSEYNKEMLMSTQNRIDYLLKLNRNINVQSLCGYSESHCFKILPCIVLLQQFIPGDIYNITFTIRNITNISRRLKILCDPNPFFFAEYRGSNSSAIIAPGLAHVYNIKFSLTEKRDYEYHIKFVNNIDILTVPVIAIGPRPILDIPSLIEVPTTAVKISSSKTILVRNIGDAPAIFYFFTNNPCFSFEPSRGILREEETMQFTINFLSEKSGDVEANLFLQYESGEKLCSVLQGSSMNYMIRINKHSVKMEDTYLGLSRSEILTIYNKSDYIVKFQWMRFKDMNTDMQKKEEYEKLFEMVHNMEVMRHISLVHYNICLPDVHKFVCQRIYADEIASLINENFRYNHTSFFFTPEVIPLQGEIWPQSSTDIMINFRTMEVGEISSIAYLEVTGREDRIPLSLYGTGKGPVFLFNVITIDLKNIYLCSVHHYEIVAMNKGHISGTLIYRAKSTNFGGTIDVTPFVLTLEPNEYKTFNLSFYSNRKGNFVERIDFIIKESLEILYLHIKGCIICPALHFNKNSLDFDTTLGFNKGQEICLRKSSLVPVLFNITITEDGDQRSLFDEEFD